MLLVNYEMCGMWYADKIPAVLMAFPRTFLTQLISFLFPHLESTTNKIRVNIQQGRMSNSFPSVLLIFLHVAYVQRLCPKLPSPYGLNNLPQHKRHE